MTELLLVALDADGVRMLEKVVVELTGGLPERSEDDVMNACAEESLVDSDELEVGDTKEVEINRLVVEELVVMLLEELVAELIAGLVLLDVGLAGVEEWLQKDDVLNERELKEMLEEELDSILELELELKLICKDLIVEDPIREADKDGVEPMELVEELSVVVEL